MNDRYLEYRRITDTLLAPNQLLPDPPAEPEHVATREELAVRKAFIDALMDEIGQSDTP